MGCEGLVVAYINPHTGLPVWIKGQSNIDDIHTLAELYVPEGTPYNIITIGDMPQPALLIAVEEVVEEDLQNIFYNYLSAL